MEGAVSLFDAYQLKKRRPPYYNTYVLQQIANTCLQFVFTDPFLGAFAKVAKHAYYRCHVCLFACTISAAPTGWIFVQFNIEDFYVNLQRKYYFRYNGMFVLLTTVRNIL
jgi:hypothetical protein